MRGLHLVTSLIVLLLVVFTIRLVVCFFSVLDPNTVLGFAVYFGLSVVLPEIVGSAVVLVSGYLYWERTRRKMAKRRPSADTVNSASATEIPSIYQI